MKQLESLTWASVLLSPWTVKTVHHQCPTQPTTLCHPRRSFYYNHPHSYIHRHVCSVHFQMVQSIKGGGFILEWLYEGYSLKISDGSANWSSPLLFCQNIQKPVPFFKKSTYFLILKAIHIHCRIQKKVNAIRNNPSKKWPLLSRSAYSSRFFPVNMFTCIYIYPYIAYTDTHKYLNLVSLPKKFITFCFIKLYVMFLSLPLSTFQYHHCIVFHHLYLP